MNTQSQSIKSHTCRTAAMGWNGNPPTVAAGLLAQARSLEIVASLASRLALAVMPALAIVIAATLAISTPGMESFLQTTLWVGGFLFYALAIDGKRLVTALLLAATGAAVQALTLASGKVSMELAVVAAALVAAWVAGAIAVAAFRRL